MAVINGTSGNNTLTGTNFADTINGLEGNDTIDARARSQESSSAARDTVDGGDGIDTLVVDASTETDGVTLATGLTPRFVVTSATNKYFIEAYNMELVKFTGGSGNDFIDTGDGGGTVQGNGGIDTWQADLSALTVNVNFTLGATTSISAAGLTSILGIEAIRLTTGLGNDKITGGARADFISTGDGDDQLDAKTRPLIAGQIDVLDGGAGTDTLIVDASAETTGVTLSAGFNPSYAVNSVSGNFLLEAYRIEKVKFTGGSGNDSINTGSGALTVNGGGGIDLWRADYSEATSNLTFVVGTTTSLSAVGLSSILNVEQINLTTGLGDDKITGGARADFISTGDGDDQLDAKTRPLIDGQIDVLDGGAGTDTLIVDASAETTGVSLAAGFNPSYSVSSVSGNFLLEAYRIEKVKFTGGSGNDSINTGSGGIVVDGGAGTDFWQADLSSVRKNITFMLGTTTAIAPAGLTSIMGIEQINLKLGSGADTITGGALADTISGGAGNDTIDMKTTSGGGVDIADGGAGVDTLIVDASAETQAVTLGSGLSPSYSVDSVSGNFDIDAYGIEKIRFTGGAGNDSINTGAGGVTVDGGAGIDTWIANLSQVSASITFTLGSTTSIAAAGLTSILRLERLNLTSGSGNDTITGGALDDVILGGAGNDTIDAKTRTAGVDIVDGGLGIDTLIVDASAETQSVNMFSGLSPVLAVDSVSGRFDLDAYGVERAVFTGGRGNDTAVGLDRDDTLAGGRGDDMLSGGDGDDTLDGGLQDDLLRGGRGADVLTGGDGKDVFDYDLITDSNAVNGKIDSIGDFVAGFDKIDLADIDANGRAVDGNQAFAFIGAAAFTNVRGQLRSAGGLIEADFNGDGTADFRITLANGATAGAGDFIL
ncbi:MAG: hypothetical protein KIS73_01650 [Enhydrobacter sp.]|nr:hypothetical protein [Enhydrobacter sp.]